MKTSSEVASIAAALSKAQGECTDIQKTKQGYGYKYAPLEPILNMVRPILAKNDLALMQSHGNDDTKVTVTTRIMHKSGEWIEDTGGVEFQALKGQNNAQSVGSAITYLRRYQVSAFMNITSDEDVDAKADVRTTKNNTQSPSEKVETLSSYLKQKGVKAQKEFSLQYGINSTEKANELLKDKAGLDTMIEEFKAKRIP